MDSGLAIQILLLAFPAGFALAVGIWGGIKMASRWYGPIVRSGVDTHAQIADALREVADALSDLHTAPPQEKSGLSSEAFVRELRDGWR